MWTAGQYTGLLRCGRGLSVNQPISSTHYDLIQRAALRSDESVRTVGLFAGQDQAARLQSGQTHGQ